MTSSDREGAALGRPSLFAAQDSLHQDLADAAGMRILSTLESQQRPPPRRRVGDADLRALSGLPSASRHSPPGGGTERWALWGLVSAGLVLASLGLWLSQEGTAQPGPLQSAAHPAHSSLPAPSSLHAPVSVATAPVPAPHTAALPQMAAVIENSPPGAGSVVANAPMAPMAPMAPIASVSPQAAGPVGGSVQPTDKPLAAASKRKPDVKASDKAHGKANEKTSGKASGKANSKDNKKAKAKADDDVALLEAMFTHAGKRQAPSSATQQISQQCGSLSGAEARACQGRVCQQFPTASICR